MILLMGSAGSGKGTQGDILVDKYGYTHLSTGEMLRAYATPEQKARMLSGVLLSDDEIIDMVDKALVAEPDMNHTILDGFPRTIAQTDWLLAKAQEYGFTISAVINLAADHDVVIERLLKRGRADDTRETLETRLKTHEELTVPVLDHLRTQGVAVYDIEADQSPEAVHADIAKVLGHADAR